MPWYDQFDEKKLNPPAFLKYLNLPTFPPYRYGMPSQPCHPIHNEINFYAKNKNTRVQ
jgi:hypothetical protein